MSKKVIIVGGGASIQEGLDKGLWENIKEQNVWSCNYAFMTMPYLPKRELWVDRSFFRNNMAALNELVNKGVEAVCKTNQAVELLPQIVSYVGVRTPEEYLDKRGIEQNRIYIGAQGFVGTFAIHVAICEGYDEIFLLGFDYGVPLGSDKNKPTHYYQGKLDIISSGIGRPEIYINQRDNSINPKVDTYSVFMKEKDVKIWNVSVLSNIPCFEKITYEEFFTKVKDGHT